MSNFTFLQQYWTDLQDNACQAVQNVNNAPRTGFDSVQPPRQAWRSLELGVKRLHANVHTSCNPIRKQTSLDKLTANESYFKRVSQLKLAARSQLPRNISKWLASTPRQFY